MACQRHENMVTLGLRELFVESQNSTNQHQLVKAFKELYNKSPFDSFWPDFRYLVLHPLIVYERDQTVEKMIDFIAKAVTVVALELNKGKEKEKKSKTSNEADDEEEEEDMHPLLLNFIEFLLDHHSAKERGPRFRVCQLITKLLQNLGEGAKIDDSLFDRIYCCMIERLRDKCPMVRVHAVLALTRLQDPADEECSVTKAYIILMTRDPNVEVRRIILTSLAPSAQSLPAIIERTRDVKDTVRRTAFNVVAEKIPLRALTIEQRIKLLQDGLNDRSDLVRIACASKLLQTWLLACDGSTLKLLDRLDVQASVKTCDSAIKELFKTQSVFDVVEQFNILDEKSLMPVTSLTPESVFYWRAVVQHVAGAGAQYDEQLDTVRPNCVEFCNFLEEVSQTLVDCTDLDKMLDIEFTIEQLLQILLCMELSDQTSRKRVSQLLNNLLLCDHVGSSLVDALLPCLAQLYTDPEELVKVLAEVISEIREPIQQVAVELTPVDTRGMDKKIAGIRVKLNQLREELGECIERQDFEKAAQLKADISGLDAERSSLMVEPEPQLEDVRTQKDDPLTMLKCLTIVCELLTMPKIMKLTPTLQTLMESQALPGMTSEEPEVRKAAVKCIGLCCLIKRDIIMTQLPLLLQASQMDTESVKVMAVRCIFDIIHVYGLEDFSDEGDDTSQDTYRESMAPGDGDQTLTQNMTAVVESSQLPVNETQDLTSREMTTNKSGWSHTATKVIAILSSGLDCENPDLRLVAAQGLAKLLLAGRVISPKLLSHLLLLWYNPTVEDDTQLIDTLGTFFPLFAFSNSTNMQLIEEATLPTLKTLLKAPSTSPLSDINEANVASFLVELTNAQLLIQNQKSQTLVTDNPYHDSLAIKLCNEILSKPDSFNVRLWLKVLTQLWLSTDNLVLVKDLCKMCEHMAIVITEKACIKLLEKFRDHVNDMHDELKNQTLQQTAAEADGEASSEATSADLSQDMSGLSITQPAKDSTTSTAPKSTRPTRAKAMKTPSVAKGDHGASRKSAMKSTKKTVNQSVMDDSVFSTPAPTRGSRVAKNIFNDSANKTPTTPFEADKTSTSKTPAKTPKRPLHTIQDPTFTG